MTDQLYHCGKAAKKVPPGFECEVCHTTLVLAGEEPPPRGWLGSVKPTPEPMPAVEAPTPPLTAKDVVTRITELATVETADGREYRAFAMRGDDAIALVSEYATQQGVGLRAELQASLERAVELESSEFAANAERAALETTIELAERFCRNTLRYDALSLQDFVALCRALKIDTESHQES